MAIQPKKLPEEARMQHSLAWIVVVVTATVGFAGELDVLPLGDTDRAYALGAAPPGTVIDTATGDAVELDAMVARMAEADVVILGEEHTHIGQKLRQAQILEALAATGRPLMLGMEFFLREDRDHLDRWSAGEMSDDELLRAVGWYDRGLYRWGYYQPLMTVAQNRGVPVVGLNVPREIPRAVNRGGLDSLTEEQRVEVGPVDVGASAQHRFLIRRYFGDTAAMMPEMWFGNMYAAQSLWDVVMARSILAERPTDGTMVVIVGSGHMAYGLGIPERLAAESDEPLDVVTYCPVQAPAPEPGDDAAGGHPMAHGHGASGTAPAVFSRSLAHYVEGFEAMIMESWPSLGLRLKTGEDDAVLVSMVWPDTRAESAGFAAGDRILAFNDTPVVDQSQLRLLLADIEWGDRVELRVQREGDEFAIAVLLAPEPREQAADVHPGWSLDRVLAFDAATGALELADEETEVSRTLMTAPDGRRWVVVRTGEVVDELHELADDGTVTLSQYRIPRKDDAK
jgi:uncharacterized iron-regulated protein